MVESRKDRKDGHAGRSITRRRFLVVTLGGGLGIASSVALSAPLPRRIRNLFSSPEPTLDADSATGLLSDKEMTEVFALAEALFPQDQDSGATQRLVHHHVNDRTANRPGYLEEYRRAVALLQRTSGDLLDSGSAFSVLSMTDRNSVLRELLESRRSGVRRVGDWIDRIFGSAEIPAFRIHVVRDLLKAFYRSPQGWAVVGYTSYPGVPARDAREYTRPLQR